MFILCIIYIIYIQIGSFFYCATNAFSQRYYQILFRLSTQGKWGGRYMRQIRGRRWETLKMKRQVGSSRRGWEDMNRLFVKDIRQEVGWLRLVFDRNRRQAVVKTVITSRLPYSVWNFLANFQRWTLLHGVIYPACTEFPFWTLCTCSRVQTCYTEHASTSYSSSKIYVHHLWTQHMVLTRRRVKFCLVLLIRHRNFPSTWEGFLESLEP